VFADGCAHYAHVSGGLLLLALGAMALIGPRPKGFAIRLAIVSAMLGVALYSGAVVLEDIDRIQDEAGILPSRLAPDDARRVRFDALHELSERLMMLHLAGGLALLWEARGCSTVAQDYVHSRRRHRPEVTAMSSRS
jgi:hypothetical protein